MERIRIDNGKKMEKILKAVGSGGATMKKKGSCGLYYGAG